MTPTDNAERAARGVRILDLLAELYQNGAPEDDLTDAFTDLCHTLPDGPHTLRLALRRGLDHYTDEVGGEA